MVTENESVEFCRAYFFEKLAAPLDVIWDEALSTWQPDAIYAIRYKTGQIDTMVAGNPGKFHPSDPRFVDNHLAIKAVQSLTLTEELLRSGSGFPPIFPAEGMLALMRLKKKSMSSGSVEIYAFSPHEDLLSLVDMLITKLKPLSDGEEYDSGVHPDGMKLPHPPDQQTRQEKEGDELLTEREQEVAQLLARGKTQMEIATDLVISHHTVRTHTDKITIKWELRQSEGERVGQKALQIEARRRGYA